MFFVPRTFPTSSSQRSAAFQTNPTTISTPGRDCYIPTSSPARSHSIRPHAIKGIKNKLTRKPKSSVELDPRRTPGLIIYAHACRHGSAHQAIRQQQQQQPYLLRLQHSSTNKPSLPPLRRLFLLLVEPPFVVGQARPAAARREEEGSHRVRGVVVGVGAVGGAEQERRKR